MQNYAHVKKFYRKKGEKESREGWWEGRRKEGT